MYLFTVRNLPVNCMKVTRRSALDSEGSGHDLNLWEGDRIFFRYLHEGEAFFHLTVQYEGDHLV
jgi:hypothetical protein